MNTEQILLKITDMFYSPQINVIPVFFTSFVFLTACMLVHSQMLLEKRNSQAAASFILRQTLVNITSFKACKQHRKSPNNLSVVFVVEVDRKNVQGCCVQFSNTNFRWTFFSVIPLHRNYLLLRNYNSTISTN